MSDKIRGIIAILVGAFALYQGFALYRGGKIDWHLWLEVVAGVLLIVIGVWRMMRKPFDPTNDLMK